jgi:hypothetical protein
MYVAAPRVQPEQAFVTFRKTLVTLYPARHHPNWVGAAPTSGIVSGSPSRVNLDLSNRANELLHRFKGQTQRLVLSKMPRWQFYFARRRRRNRLAVKFMPLLRLAGHGRTGPELGVHGMGRPGSRRVDLDVTPLNQPYATATEKRADYDRNQMEITVPPLP